MPSNLDDRQQPPVRLSIPDLPPGVDTLTAALAYAECGWYVLPVRMDTKHPGSVVGKGWPSRSSRDPKQLAAWFAGTSYGVALHAGRSGAIALDVDHPEHTPDEVMLIMESGCPYQSTRPGEPGRGHYLVANTTGRRIGNSVGKLATTPAWGEIRGTNGVIIVEPSQHPSGGEYRWIRTGPLPDMPDYLAEALPTSCSSEDAATDGQIERFFESHTETTRPEALRGLENILQAKLAAGQSCHMSTLGVLTDAMQEAAAGYYGALEASRRLWPIYLATAKNGTSTGRTLTAGEARHQYAGILAWAVGQADTPVAADAAEARCSQRYKTAVHELQPEPPGEPTAPPAPPAAAVREGRLHAGVLELENNFWESRDSLQLIYEFSMSRMVSPWAVLAHCVARALHTVRPAITFPPVIGGRGSLNWFAALVATSGAGKGAAESAANELVDAKICNGKVGTGEGLVNAYQGPKPGETREAVLFTVNEVAQLEVLMARAGNTLASTLCECFSADSLGFGYAKNQNRVLPAHSYRMTMVVSVQPRKAAALFGRNDEGLTQRFMWFPARDFRATRDAKLRYYPRFNVQRPEKMTFPAYTEWMSERHLSLPEGVAKVIELNREHQNQALLGDLEGHVLFSRLKFAFGLTLIDRRISMTLEDWQLSGIAAAVSNLTRDWTIGEMQEGQREHIRAKGDERAEFIDAVDNSKLNRIQARKNIIGDQIVAKLREAGPAGLTESKLKQSFNGNDRLLIQKDTFDTLAEQKRIVLVAEAEGRTSRLWRAAPAN